MFSNSPTHRTGRLQPVHLPFAARIHRYRSGHHVSALWNGTLRQGVHRQTDQPIQVLRVRVLRQCVVGASGHPGDARLPDWRQTAQGAAETLQGSGQTVLTPDTLDFTRHWVIRDCSDMLYMLLYIICGSCFENAEGWRSTVGSL